MDSTEIKKWAKFYAALIGVNIVNGTIMYLKVAVAAGTVETMRGFDIRTISSQTLLWTWLSAVAVQIIVELSKNLVPNPKPPETLK